MKQLFFFLGFSLLVFSAKAQTATVTADTVVDKYLKAVGGADKWKAVESMRQTGSIIVQGMTIPFTQTQAKPNLTRSEGDFQGQKFIQLAFDGTVAWSMSPWETMNKPVKKNEEETKEAAKDMFEDDFIDYKTKGHTVELQGTEEIDGAKCLKVSLKRKVGDEKIYYFDADSYVPVMYRSFASVGPMKGQAIDVYLSDYKDEGGLMIPHTIEQKVKGQTAATIKMDKIELNPTVDKTIFALPK